MWRAPELGVMWLCTVGGWGPRGRPLWLVEMEAVKGGGEGRGEVSGRLVQVGG